MPIAAHRRPAAHTVYDVTRLCHYNTSSVIVVFISRHKVPLADLIPLPQAYCHSECHTLNHNILREQNLLQLDRVFGEWIRRQVKICGDIFRGRDLGKERHFSKPRSPLDSPWQCVQIQRVIVLRYRKVGLCCMLHYFN